MSFPISPSNGATTLVNGITYVYNSTTNAWTRVVASLGNLTIAGNINAEKVYTTSGLYWATNARPVVGSGINMTTDTVPPGDPVVGDQWYATDIGVLFEYLDDGDSLQWVDITSSSISANSIINLTSGDFSILGNITPGLTGVYDLGNVSYKWRNIYVGGTATLSNASSTSGYFWANGAPAFYSNSAVAQYLTVYTGNIAAGNANIGKVTTTSGVFWANGTPAVYSNTAVAQYLPAYTGALTAGNATITGNLIVTDGSQSNYYNSGGAGKGIDIVTTATNKVGYLNLVGGSSSSGLLTFGNISSVQAAISTGTDNSITIATKGAGTGANIMSEAFNIYSDQTARFVSNLSILGNVSIGANVTSNVTFSQSGLFRGPYNENSTLSGVFVGNTGSGTPSPRIGFFNGNTQQNWQIDNFGGAFRWFVPGATKLTLYDSGNLNVTGGYTVGGKKAVNGPAFSAYADATGQTITSGSQQKVLFQTEEFDTDNCYANSRFTPTVEGYYQLNAEVRLDGASGTGEMMIVIRKNGAELKRGTNQSGTQIAANFWAMTVSSLVYANGTGDYFEIYVQQGSGSSVTVTAVNAPNITWFNGAMVRGA